MSVEEDDVDVFTAVPRDADALHRFAGVLSSLDHADRRRIALVWPGVSPDAVAEHGNVRAAALAAGKLPEGVGGFLGRPVRRSAFASPVEDVGDVVIVAHDPQTREP